MIYSRDLLNGGLSSREVERRWCVENGVEKGGEVGLGADRSSKRMSKRSERRSSRGEQGNGRGVQRERRGSVQATPHRNSIQTWSSGVVGQGEMSPALPPRPGVG